MPSFFSVGEARGNSFFNCLLSSSIYLMNKNQVTITKVVTHDSISEIKESTA